MPEGFYDALITRALRRDIALSTLHPTTASVEPAELPEVLAEHVRRVARSAFASMSESTRREAVERMLVGLDAEDEGVDGEPARLLSLLAPAAPGHAARYLGAPETPLSQPALLTNARGEPTMGSEIASELGSADRVELLCAFIKWYGIRTLEKQLVSIRERGIPFRVITSTYLGSTERAALDRLIEQFGADVRVSYETTRTRLHAKAWRFYRNTGFDTAYVGSSNLTSTAMLDGVEWNVRLTATSTPDLLRKFTATFDSYWNDPAFEPYTLADGERLERALAEASGRSRQTAALTVSGLEVRPWPHQDRMLEALEVEREVHDRHRNLVVAATGTGKTVVAALDYQRLAAARGSRPSLLFVAHRREILEQSLRTYREVLADGGFGELLVAGYRPAHWKHVFASVQSLNAEALAHLCPGRAAGIGAHRRCERGADLRHHRAAATGARNGDDLPVHLRRDVEQLHAAADDGLDPGTQTRDARAVRHDELLRAGQGCRHAWLRPGRPAARGPVPDTAALLAIRTGCRRRQGLTPARRGVASTDGTLTERACVRATQRR